MQIMHIVVLKLIGLKIADWWCTFSPLNENDGHYMDILGI